MPRLTKRLIDDLVAADLGVQPRPGRSASIVARAMKARKVSLAPCVLVLLLELVPDRDDLRHVDLEHRRDVGRRLGRANHVLGDRSPHDGHRLDRLAGGRLSWDAGLRRRPVRRRRRRRPTAASAAASDAAAARAVERSPVGDRRRARSSMNSRMSFFVTRPPRAGARHLRDVDGVLGGDSRDDRRDECTTLRVTVALVGLGGSRRPGADTAIAAERRLPRSTESRPRRRLPAPAASGRASAAPGSPDAITARVVPTATVSPSWTTIWPTTPAAGLGTSVSTLSVEISSRGSSAATASPSDFSHFVIVPSGDRDAHLRHHDVDGGSCDHVRRPSSNQ